MTQGTEVTESAEPAGEGCGDRHRDSCSRQAGICAFPYMGRQQPSHWTSRYLKPQELCGMLWSWVSSAIDTGYQGTCSSLCCAIPSTETLSLICPAPLTPSPSLPTVALSHPSALCREASLCLCFSQNILGVCDRRAGPQSHASPLQ